MTSTEQVIARLKGAELGLRQPKRKMYRLRRIVAGDAEALKDDAFWANTDEAAQLVRPLAYEFPSILVTSIEEGRNNGMLKAIRTLVLQTAYFFPETEFRNIESELAQLNAKYLKERLREAPFGCSAQHHMRMVLLDYAMGGMGWAYVSMERGLPTIRFADTLDMKWDQTARLPQDIQWASVTIAKTLGYWVKMFGVGKFRDRIPDGPGMSNDPMMDSPVELEFYYDLADDGGTYVVLAKTGENEYDPTPIFKAKSPCYFEVVGQPVPFLPFECMFFMALPSVRHPMGIAEGMLPAQIATWRADRTIRDILDRGAGFYEYDADRIDAKALRKFEDGETGAFLGVKAGSNDAIRQKPPMELPQYLIAYRRIHEEEMTEQSGANPFATGDKVDGVNFAAQVNAIEANAGLTAGTIAKDNADCWERVIRKLLAKGKVYDTKPFECYLDGVLLKFDATNPISFFLRPDAEFSVREDSMKFRPREQKIQEAAMLLQLVMPLQARYPAALDRAFKKVLDAMNEESPEKWMEVPQQAPGMPPGMPQGMPPGAQPGAPDGGPMPTQAPPAGI